jgi:predicted XRE-type DNA-binding protein
MRWTEALQGVRMAMFLNLLTRWESAELNQAEAAELLGVSERTFRRWARREIGVASAPNEDIA